MNLREGNTMKENIHPAYETTTITCACGNVIEVGSTKKAMKTDTCSACHPFFTGLKQSIASKGRAAKFAEKYGTKLNK